MKCFYDFECIKFCINCNKEFKTYVVCDNSCGSFECESCKKEFYAQYTNDLKMKQLEQMMKAQYRIFETSKGFIIVAEKHNPECGDFECSDFECGDFECSDSEC